MPIEITGTHYVIFDGVLSGLDYLVFQVHAGYVSVTRKMSGQYWRYDIENNEFTTVNSSVTGLAQGFIDATGIRGKQVGNVINVSTLSQEDIDYKAEDIG